MSESKLHKMGEIALFPLPKHFSNPDGGLSRKKRTQKVRTCCESAGNEVDDT